MLARQVSPNVAIQGAAAYGLSPFLEGPVLDCAGVRAVGVSGGISGGSSGDAKAHDDDGSNRDMVARVVQYHREISSETCGSASSSSASSCAVERVDGDNSNSNCNCDDGCEQLFPPKLASAMSSPTDSDSRTRPDGNAMPERREQQQGAVSRGNGSVSLLRFFQGGATQQATSGRGVAKLVSGGGVAVPNKSVPRQDARSILKRCLQSAGRGGLPGALAGILQVSHSETTDGGQVSVFLSEIQSFPP